MDETPVNNELSLKQDNLQDNGLTEKQPHNTTTLNSLLQIEAESPANDKDEQHTMQYILKVYLRKMSIGNRVAYKKNLEHQLELVCIQKSHFEIQMFDTATINDKLLRDFVKLRSKYRNAIVLKNKCREQFANFQLQEENILKQIHDKKAQISGIQDYNVRDLLQYKAEVNKRNHKLTESSEAINKIKIEVENAKNQVEVFKTEYEKNNVICLGLNQNVRFIQNSINDYSSLLEEFEAKRIIDKENIDLMVKNIKEELNSYIKVLAGIARNEIILKNACIGENNKTMHLNELFSKLEEENVKLQLEKQQLIKRKGDIINKSNVLQLNLSKHLRAIQLKELLPHIVLAKENKLKNAELLKQKIHESELKFVELQGIRTKLICDKLVNTNKLESLSHLEADIKTKTGVLKTSFAVAQKKLIEENEKNETKDSDLDSTLLFAQSQLQEVINQFETTRKNGKIKLNAYKHQTQLADQQNQEDNGVALEELTNEVAKLKSDVDLKSKRLSETMQLIIVKKEVFEKYSKELNVLRKKDLLAPRFKNTTSIQTKPVGILKPPGKTGISLKRQKFDVTNDLIADSEFEIHSKNITQSDML